MNPLKSCKVKVNTQVSSQVPVDPLNGESLLKATRSHACFLQRFEWQWPHRFTDLSIWFPVGRLFRKIWEVCWRRYVPEGELWGFTLSLSLSPHPPSKIRIQSSELLLQCPACLFPATWWLWIYPQNCKQAPNQMSSPRGCLGHGASSLKQDSN